MIWCWANAFDIDPALNHHHIEYNYYSVLRQRFKRWPSIKAALNQQWPSLFHVWILIYCLTPANTRFFPGAGWETGRHHRRWTVALLGLGRCRCICWSITIVGPILICLHSHPLYLHLIFMHTCHINWRISLKGWVLKLNWLNYCFLLYFVLVSIINELNWINRTIK